jgi:hypothetical protein
MSLKARIGNNEVILENANTKAIDSSPQELKSIFSLTPEITQENLVRLIFEFNKKTLLSNWKTQIGQRNHLNKIAKDKMEISEIVFHWNRVINEFLDFKYILDIGQPIQSTQIHLFDIVRLYSKLKSADSEKFEIAYRLIDVKMYYCFLWSIMFYNYDGTFKIVGNNDLEELTPEAITHLSGLTNKICLMSILIEKTLDLIELVATGKCTDHKKGKWQKKISTINAYLTISPDDQKKLNDFKNIYRTAELHKLSAVRSMTSKSEWNHLQEEEKIIYGILNAFYEKVVSFP